MRLEERSTNTGENIRFSIPLLQALAAEGFSVKTLLGIGKVFAARRCLMTLHAFLPDSQNMFFGINTFDVPVERWQDCPQLKAKVLGEYDKIRRYRNAGFIVDDPSLPRENAG